MGKGREPSCRRGPGKALAWPLVLASHPAHQNWSETRGAAPSPRVGAGLGRAICSSLLRKRRQSGNAFVTAHGQHKGGHRRSFLSRRKGEGQRPTSGPACSSQMLWKDVLATSSLLGGVFPSHWGRSLGGPSLQGWAHTQAHKHTHIHIFQGLWGEATSY